MYYTTTGGRLLRWDSLKNARLKRERGFSFDEVVCFRLVAAIAHGSRPNQRLFLFERDARIWVVPFVDNGDYLFLKTLFPSRTFTKRWLRGAYANEEKNSAH